MIKFATLLFLLATSLPAVTLDVLVGGSIGSPHIFGNAKIKDIVIVGAEVSTGKTLEYVASFRYLTVPGSHIDNYAVTPLGGRLNFPFPSHRIHLFLLANGGIIASTRPIPIPRPNATGLNFIANVGAGIQLGRWVSVRYELQHVSNADTTRYNPAFENNMLLASFTIFGGAQKHARKHVTNKKVLIID